MKHWRVYVIADDPYCMGHLQFDAHTAILVDKYTLLIDGKKFKSSEGFHTLEEGWIN